MLRSFRVINHRSIRDEQEFQLMPAYDKNRPVIPVAAIFGANASGKSNILDALRFMRSAVVDSFSRWEPAAPVPRTPFRLTPEAATTPSTYAVDIVIDNTRYAYGFTLDDHQILEEWLHAYPLGRRRVIFDRTGPDIKFGTTIAESKDFAELLERFTRPSALVLSVTAQSEWEPAMPAYGWFRDVLTFAPTPGNLDLESLRKRLALNSFSRAAFVSLVRQADLGITDVAVEDYEDPLWRERAAEAIRSYEDARAEEAAAVHRLAEVTPDAESMDRARGELRVARNAALEAAARVDKYHGLASNSKKTRLLFRHVSNQSTAVFGLNDESNGTRTWLGLLDRALSAIEAGAVMVVDEVDASLHPQLTARLVRLFQGEETNPRHAQLVFTTHDASLLGTSLDGELLARDQVFFVEKDREGATSLYALTDFHPRKEDNRERRYLGGSYGAVPVISDYEFAKALTTRGEEHHASSEEPAR
ncbi:MAG: AAA family ATPase [Mycobacteriales bacterium]